MKEVSNEVWMRSSFVEYISGVVEIIYEIILAYPDI